MHRQSCENIVCRPPGSTYTILKRVYKMYHIYFIDAIIFVVYITLQKINCIIITTAEPFYIHFFSTLYIFSFTFFFLLVSTIYKLYSYAREGSFSKMSTLKFVHWTNNLRSINKLLNFKVKSSCVVAVHFCGDWILSVIP